MANNYVEASFAIPDGWPIEAKRDFVNALDYAGACVGRGRSEDEDKNLYLTADWTLPDYMQDLELFKEYVRGGESYLGGTVWYESDGSCGYYNEEDYDEMCIGELLQCIADRYRIKRINSLTVSTAATCSKPRIDEFGGTQEEYYDRTTQPDLPCFGQLRIKGAICNDPTFQADLCEAVEAVKKEDLLYFPELRINKVSDRCIAIWDSDWFWYDKWIEVAAYVIRERKAMADISCIWIYRNPEVDESGCINISGSDLYRTPNKCW